MANSKQAKFLFSETSNFLAHNTKPTHTAKTVFEGFPEWFRNVKNYLTL